MTLRGLKRGVIMDGRLRILFSGMVLAAILSAGCYSPYRSDKGALFGGAVGAGTGAAIGQALGNPLAGAAIGAGVGAVTGAAVGNEMDEMEAKNRALIEQKLGRQVVGAPVTTADVVAMTRAGVNEDLICNHIRSHGVAVPLQAGDLIALQQQGVSPRVIAEMQAPPAPPQGAVYAQPVPMVAQPVYYDPYWGPYYYYPHPHCRPRVSWGVTVGH